MKKNSSALKILVVGAGPTGLALAASLARNNVQVRIIDKNAAASDQSKAIGVQAGTLEAVQDVLGVDVSNRMVTCGLPASDVFLHFDERDPLHLNLSGIPSKYNFLLVLSQKETERILEQCFKKYGGRVGRNQELINSVDTGSKVQCKIKHHSGRTENYEADYVVGCDGAHSTVRRNLEMPFSGGTYTSDFILADVKVDWPWSYGVVRAFFSKYGLMGCFPMKGSQLYRFILVPKGEAHQTAKNISFEELCKTASKLAQKPMTLSDPVWFTRFRVHHRMAKSIRQGRIFLAGDAAHIHSPAGGQGMNTGIQDALNLAHKFKVINEGKMPSVLLESYEKERLPVAKGVLRATHFFSSLMLLPENFLFRTFRSFVLPRVFKSPRAQFQLGYAMSEVKIARREIIIRQREASPSATHSVFRNKF